MAGTSHIKVRMVMQRSIGGDVYYAGEEYSVDKKTAEVLLDDERVAVPVKSSGKTEHATTEE